MFEVVQRLVGICLFQNGPQDLPASWNLLIVALAVDIALGYPAAMAYSPGDYAGLQILVATAVTAVFVYGAVNAIGQGRRFVQTATAVFGTDAIITLMALPIALTMAPGPRTAVTLGDLGLLAMGVWNIAILGHILRHALSVTLGIGVMVALGYTLAVVLITGAITG
ncbi:hypothetical protein H0Z60_07220 [Ectothiorhodospiraceae bacterium WFHF3C12]|nr:hypothetical protein [Ectothiorhodospiraceae bacterium WFHF3C12]